MPLPDFTDDARFSPSQQGALRLLAESLTNTPIPEASRLRLLLERAQGYLRRNAERAAVRHGEPTLAERAEQARLDFERAKNLRHYARDVKTGKAKPPSERQVLVPIPRYALDCIHCEVTMHLFSRAPRVPLCQSCKVTRAAKRAHRHSSMKGQQQ